MITKKICMNCGSEEVYMIAGGVTGQWMCKNCGHVGSVLEKEILGKELRDTDKKGIKNRKYKKFPYVNK